MSHNKFGPFSSIKIPPESTGPEIQNLILHELEFNAGTGPFAVGQTVVGLTSGAIGEIVNYQEDTPLPSLTGAIIVQINAASTLAHEFELGETFQNSDGETGVIIESYDSFVNTSAIVGGNNPYHRLRIDESGAAFMRGPEGHQQLDAFGLSRMSTPVLVAMYEFLYTKQNPFLSEIVTAGGTVTHLPLEASVGLSTTSALGDFSAITSDQYYPYIPGVGRSILMTIQNNDSGTAGNVRRWGYFDENNGVFFQLDENGLNVVVRTNTSGSVVNTVINQDNWNGDRVNGLSDIIHNPSAMDIDTTKMNIFWIDLQWLGAGRVRFGVSDETGARIICHSIENANNNLGVYMAMGTLPLRVENENIGATSGISTLKWACASVLNDGGDFNEISFQTPKSLSYVGPNSTGVTTEKIYMSLRSASTFAGLPNHITSSLASANVHAKSNGAIIRIYRGTTLSGSPSWGQANAASPLEVDTSASGFSGGTLVGTIFVNIGSEYLATVPSLRSFTKYDQSEIIFTITVEQIDNSATSDVRMALSWNDQE